jgi:hypothetical protein
VRGAVRAEPRLHGGARLVVFGRRDLGGALERAIEPPEEWVAGCANELYNIFAAVGGELAVSIELVGELTVGQLWRKLELEVLCELSFLGAEFQRFSFRSAGRTVNPNLRCV